MLFSVGAVVDGRYEVLRVIKAGGMGAVYEVLHRDTRRRRAMKVMLPSIVSDEGFRARFQQEAVVTADIESEHIVETFDAGIDSETGSPYLVMELLRGEDLGEMVERRGPLPADEVVILLQQAALALDKTHRAGIIHRDLKPENLFVTKRDDGSARLKVLDFGIAKVMLDSTRGAQTSTGLGTPLYMSPEQLTGKGRVGPPSDNYALGHIAFALLAGDSYWAFEANRPAFELMVTVLSGLQEPATVRAAMRGVTLPPTFDAFFARATALDASQRYAKASELVEALAAAVRGIGAQPIAQRPSLGSPVAHSVALESRNPDSADEETRIASTRAAGSLASGQMASGPVPSGPVPSGPVPSGPVPSGPIASGAMAVRSGSMPMAATAVSAVSGSLHATSGAVVATVRSRSRAPLVVLIVLLVGALGCAAAYFTLLAPPQDALQGDAVATDADDSNESDGSADSAGDPDDADEAKDGDEPDVEPSEPASASEVPSADVSAALSVGGPPVPPPAAPPPAAPPPPPKPAPPPPPPPVEPPPPEPPPPPPVDPSKVR